MSIKSQKELHEAILKKINGYLAKQGKSHESFQEIITVLLSSTVDVKKLIQKFEASEKFK